MTVLMVNVRIKTDIVAVRTRQYNVCCFVYYIYVYIIYIVFPKWGINVSIVKRHIFTQDCASLRCLRCKLHLHKP